MAFQQPANKVFLNGKPLTYKPVTSWAEELSEPTPKVIASSVTVVHDFEIAECEETTETYTGKLKINFDDNGIDLAYQEHPTKSGAEYGLVCELTIPSKALAIKLAELILDYYGC
jgi:hypothetical protein